MEFISVELWAPSFWLPPNVTWSDLERVRSRHQNDSFYQEFLYPGVLALAITLLRYLTDRYVLEPTGRYLKVKETTEKAEHNVLLEEAFDKSSDIDNEKVLRLAKQCDWSEQRVRRWWNTRRGEDEPSDLWKFCECAWEGGFYIYSFSYGVFVLWDKPWAWDHTAWFSDMPHEITNDIWWYYLFSTGYYYALTVDHLRQYKLKDFWGFFIHHLITILLLTLSRISNLQRVGTVVLILHDCSDILIEYAKIARYTGYQKVCNYLFVVYTALWVILRLYIYPFHVVLRCFENPGYNYPVFKILTWLLALMCVVHIYWTFRILQLIRKAFFAKKQDNDQQTESQHLTSNSRAQDQSISNGVHRKAE